MQRLTTTRRPTRRFPGWFDPCIIPAVCLLCALLQGAPARVHAQPPDDPEETPTAFLDKQRLVNTLLREQTPVLAGLEAEAADVWKRTAKLDADVRPRTDLTLIRTQALDALVGLRKENDGLRRRILELHFAWLPYELDLMAYYIRFGELKRMGRVEPDMEKFIEDVRAHARRLKAVSETIDRTYKSCDFLLTAKLN